MSVPLAHDPAVPQRDALLDGATVARRLAAERCVRVRATYGFGRRLRALHRIEAGGSPVLVAATAPARTGTAAPDAHDAELDASYWVYPNDRKLRSLGALARPAPELVRALGRPWVASRLAAWAPEKSATVRCLDRHGAVLAYAKTYAEDGAAAALRHELLARRVRGAVRVPAVLAYAEEHRALFLEPLAGRPLALDARDLGRLGATLAALHALPADGLPRFDRVDGGRLARTCELLGRARPDVARAAERLGAELEARRPDTEGRTALLHGDPHAKNVLVGGGSVALVDLDQAAAGPPAAELGGVLASLRYRRCLGELTAAHERALADRLLAAYASAGELPSPAELAWHTAAALLVERAMRAVHRVRLPGLLRLDALLADARSLLA